MYLQRCMDVKHQPVEAAKEFVVHAQHANESIEKN